MRPKLTGVAIALAAVILALSALDEFLARVESSELHGTAQQAYLAGSRLLAAGKASEAIEPLREAHSMERENPEYELAMITALTDAGKTTDAEPLMGEMLEREPNNGRTNLIAARLAGRAGDAADAEAYYHRAVYGEWPDDPAAHRIAARMELVAYLQKRERKQELVAELISLGAEPTASVETRRRLAQLFMEADAPGRAADVYRALAEKDPQDIAASEGLGDAELEQGHYNDARAAYEQAFYRAPADPSIQAHLGTLNTVVALDPTLRQLTSGEKYQRSIRILELARTALSACAASQPPPGGDSARLLPAADAAISATPPAHVTNEAAESVLALAETVWRSRNQACAASAGEADPLNLLMKKLAS